MKLPAPKLQVGASPWSIGCPPDQAKPLFSSKWGSFDFRIYHVPHSLWLVAIWPKGNRVCFRAAFFPSGESQIVEFKESTGQVTVKLKCRMGIQTVKVRVPDEQTPLRYTTTFKCSAPTLFPFWPRDIVSIAKNGKPLRRKGTIHIVQKGTRSGLLYASLPKPGEGSFLYFQNLTALNAYCNETKTSAGDVVGGQWPELGFALPVTKENPLPAGKDFVISDALVVIRAMTPRDEFEMAKGFLDSLADVYLQLKLPQTEYCDWPDITEKSLHDLETCPGCWTHLDGHDYLNAYLSDYSTPPESMVQLAVLVPLLEYEKWLGRKLPIIERIEEGLPNFFDKKVSCIGRWLPETEEQLSGTEEQKKPRVMDSWYQLHTLLNLSRMALHGNKTAKKLFLDSIDYAIKVAHKFKYRWPVFYNVDTLEILKAETSPGNGGQKDVPGSYAHVMLQAWELTHETRFLAEAKKAAMALKGAGLKLLYQANNTAFASGALLRLYKETRDKAYLELSYLCIANLFENVSLWEGRYGFGKHHSTFFVVFPLDDAPYTAVYEEQEVFAALSNYIQLAEGEDILPSVRLLVAEFIRFAAYRAQFYYPPLLAKEMLADSAKTGELNKRLWIPIEDMHDGWEKSGKVGQEVYGAGQAFGFLCRHFIQAPNAKLTVNVEYPITSKVIKPGSMSFYVGGDARLACQIYVASTSGKIASCVIVKAQNKRLLPKKTRGRHLEYTVSGAQEITVSWTTPLETPPGNPPATATARTSKSRQKTR